MASSAPAVGVLISAEVRATQAPLAVTSATSVTRVRSFDNRRIVVLHMQCERPQDTAGTCILPGGVDVKEQASSGRSRSAHSIARGRKLLAHNAGAAASDVGLPVVDESDARWAASFEE